VRVFVFPGQGSEKKGMAAELFDQVEAFTSVEADIDALLGYSLRELCNEDPRNQISQTQFTQPALFVANALHYYQRIGGGDKADMLAGHSLGEYNALLAAGAFDLLTGVKLVRKRGALMAQAKDGGMAAVIGLQASTIQSLLAEHDLSSVDLANFNSPLQTVVSGPVADIQRAKQVFTDAGAKLCVVLPASAAFHSRYMVNAAKEYESFLDSIAFGSLQIPVIANVTAQPYPSAASDRDIKSLLVQQIHRSVRWTDSILTVKNANPHAEFEEVGPGKVLTKLIRQI
jgi:malonyl CoA-acyl carrier protein transacylase